MTDPIITPIKITPRDYNQVVQKNEMKSLDETRRAVAELQERANSNAVRIAGLEATIADLTNTLAAKTAAPVVEAPKKGAK